MTLSTILDFDFSHTAMQLTKRLFSMIALFVSMTDQEKGNYTACGYGE